MVFFAGAGALFGLKHANYRQVAVSLLLVVVLNLLFHLDYQFRGSVYIYAAHLHFAIFALGMGAAPWVAEQLRVVRLGYVGVLLALAVASLVINTQRASNFVLIFDTLAYPAADSALRP